MSIITTEKDYSTNNPLDAGYFRVGFVTLQIPPQDIVTSRVVNNEKITPLRGMNEMFQKTGQARWDVTVSWTALLNDADQVTQVSAVGRPSQYGCHLQGRSFRGGGVSAPAPDAGRA